MKSMPKDGRRELFFIGLEGVGKGGGGGGKRFILKIVIAKGDKMFMCNFIYLFIYLFVYLFIYLFIYFVGGGGGGS